MLLWILALLSQSPCAFSRQNFSQVIISDFSYFLRTWLSELWSDFQNCWVIASGTEVNGNCALDKTFPCCIIYIPWKMRSRVFQILKIWCGLPVNWVKTWEWIRCCLLRTKRMKSCNKQNLGRFHFEYVLKIQESKFSYFAFTFAPLDDPPVPAFRTSCPTCCYPSSARCMLLMLCCSHSFIGLSSQS